MFETMSEMMKTSSKVILFAFLTGGLVSGSAWAQSTNKTSPKAKGTSEHSANGDNSGKRRDSNSSSGRARGEQAQRADESAPTDASDVLKKIREEFKQAQNTFVEEQKELRQKLKEATDDDRARIRNEIQIKRQNFLDQQLEVRDEIRRRASDLKDKLKDHQDVLDAAKEAAKDKAKSRKGGSD
jgi:hypothetical protein